MKPNEMRIGKPYIVTKGSDDGTFEEGDHISIVGNGDVLCEEAGGWTRSLVEEVIGCLWLIAAVIAFGFKFDTLGWLLAIKAATDQGCAIWFSVKEAIAEKKAPNEPS